MINIKELAVGNWVRFPHGIDKIDELCMWANYAAPATNRPVHVLRLEPIEITPEILEKNGWKFENGYSDTVDSIGRMIEYYHFEGILRLYVDDKPYTTIGSGLMYVHQLQNALTLCGIDKEIEL